MDDLARVLGYRVGTPPPSQTILVFCLELLSILLEFTMMMQRKNFRDNLPCGRDHTYQEEED